MIKTVFGKLFISGFLSLFLISILVFNVSAANQAQTSQSTYIINLDPLHPIEMGQSFILSGTIEDLQGNPLADKPIFFSINGEYLGQTPSDQEGEFSREFKQSLDAGIHKITADNNRDNLFNDNSPFVFLSIFPAKVRVQVTPPIPDVGFMMDGRKFFTDQEGLATIEINKYGTYRLTVLDDEYDHPGQRIELGRWTEEIYQPYQDISVPTNRVIQVGLNVYQIFSMDFIDLEGEKVDPSRVTEFTIRSLQGDVFVLNDGEPRWFPASRTARRLTGLEETKLYYSILNVIVDGSNVVNQSQQRFYTSAGGNLTIELILYSLQVNAKDGLFGWPIGKSLLLEFPDGRIEEYPLDEQGTVKIDSLARGTYFLRISGVKGIDNRIPVALSRDQNINMKVITNLDIAVFGAFGLIFVLGLLLYGRPWIINSTVNTVKNSYEKMVSKYPGIPNPEVEVEPNLTSTTPRIKKKNNSKKKTNQSSISDPTLLSKVAQRIPKGVK